MEKKFPSSVLVALHRGGDVLFLRRTGDDAWAGLWTWPGGAVEVDESPDDCAHREIAEETGWQVTDFRLLAVRTARSRAEGRRFHLYVAEAPSGTPRLNAEHDAWAWHRPRWFFDQPIDHRAERSSMFSDWLDAVARPFVRSVDQALTGVPRSTD